MAKGSWIGIVYLLILLNCCKNTSTSELNEFEVHAIISQESDSTRDSTGSLVLFAKSAQRIVLAGTTLEFGGQIAFTTSHTLEDEQISCDDVDRTRSFDIDKVYGNGSYAAVTINLELLGDAHAYYHLCTRREFFSVQTGQLESHWRFHGTNQFLRLSVQEREVKTTILPIYLQVLMIGFLLCLSGLFSGLNLGLMALDKTELKIIEKCGKSKEKKYAKSIAPIRKRGNFLLCTLLLGNVLVNNSLTILLDDVSNGLYAVIGATLGIVVFGEIIPQAICSRHGLAVGARTIWITRMFMILTFPLSFPISLLLDKILGEEIGQVYDRNKLQELMRVTKDFNDLKNEEMNIISGALDLSTKSVTEVMTRIEDVYMLDINGVLDFETVSEIMKKGYTRIPVYDGDKSHICALLNIKDLALIDPDDKTPLRTVVKFYQHPLVFVFDDQKLDTMLQDFRQGHSHMAIVRRVNNEGEGDPYYETLGVLTLEDVIEEIIQSEIIDETDIITDNRQKAPRKLARQDFTLFNQPDDLHQPWISPQLALATFQFLSTSVDLFKDDYISENVLKRLIKQNIVEEVLQTDTSGDHYLYKESTPCDFFILILQGQVEVILGKEKMRFCSGPFSYYGTQALHVSDNLLGPANSSDSLYIKTDPYIPDFSVRVESNNLVFLRIRRAHYIAARRSTLMGKSKFIEDEAFSKEWKKANFIASLSNSSDNATKDMRRISSLSVPFSDLLSNEAPNKESSWSVQDHKGEGITLKMSDVEVETRERSSTDPTERIQNTLEHSKDGRERSDTAGSGDSLGWEKTNINSGEQDRLIEDESSKADSKTADL